MSRFDKYNPVSGGFRAPLNIALTAVSGPSGVTDLNRILCVSVNSSGRIIKAVAALEVVGVIVANQAMAAGDIIDVMTDGEIVEMGGADIQGGTAAAAGARLFYDSTASRLAAVASPVAGTNYALIGRMIEANRLVVRTRIVQG